MVVILYVVSCMSVTMLVAIHLNIENKVPLSYLWGLIDTNCVDFIEKHFVQKLWQRLQITGLCLLCLTLMENKESDGFFSR